MRSLLDVRLSRGSLLLLAAVSAVATVLILTAGGGRTPAQTAALAALRERPATVAAAGPGPAQTTAASPGTVASTGPRPLPAGPHAGVPSHLGGTTTPATAVPVASAPTPTPSTPAPAPHRTTRTASRHTTPLAKIGHVFELVVSTRGGSSAFGARSDLPYLRSLARRGTLLTGYRTLGAGPLADELALVSGQGPNPETTHGCRRYTDFSLHASPDAAGVIHGDGCVYPDSVLTVGDQVTATGKTWHAYVDDMGSENCVHPNSDAVDDTALPFADPGYDTRENPFIYFHSLLDLGDCANDDIDLGHLPSALRSAHATPEFDYVAPGACANSDPTLVTTTTTSSTTTTTATTPAATTTSTTSATTTAPASSTTTAATTPPGTGSTTTPPAPAGCPHTDPSGPAAENAFLRTWIPRILASAAYRRDGLLVIAATPGGPADGRRSATGALVLSRFTGRGRRLRTAANPYSLLRLEEDALRLKHLAHAASASALAPQLVPARG